MKKILLINVLFLSFIISKAQIIENSSLEVSGPLLGFGVIPDSWSQSGISQGLMNAEGNPRPLGAPPFTRPILDLFESADSDDLFWHFFLNTAGQFGGISQVLQNLEPNTEYCFSFEAAVNRFTTPSTTIDFELYFDQVLMDSETFNYPSETSSRRVELCFTTEEGITSGVMYLRTNNLQGATTFILIQAGSGEFGNSSSTTPTFSAEFSESFEVFPNPTNGRLSIDFNETLDEPIIYVYSAIGNLVFEKKYLSSKKINLDLTFLESGIYFLELVSGDKSITRKIILEK